MELLLFVSLAWFYVVSSFVVSFVAGEKGRGQWSWWAISFVVSPVIALLALAALPPAEEEEPAVVFWPQRPGSWRPVLIAWGAVGLVILVAAVWRARM